MVFVAGHCFTGTVSAGEKEDTATPTPVPYDLSYPGLLPDHPLYPLKMVRDNLMTMLIGKPLDKASFLLLQSDKHVLASKLLLQKNDIELAYESFVNAQKYFDEAVSCVREAKKEGMSTHDAINKLQTASKKHHQIVHEMKSELNGINDEKFQEIDKKAETNIKISTSLKP